MVFLASRQVGAVSPVISSYIPFQGSLFAVIIWICIYLNAYLSKVILDLMNLFFFVLLWSYVYEVLLDLKDDSFSF